MATPSDPNLNKIDMVDLKKVTKVKVGDRIDFYLFSKLEEGVVYRIEEWDSEKGIQIGIEHGGSYPGEWGVGEFRPYRYLVRSFIKLPKKGNDRPPWYIIASSPQIRKKNERQNLQ